MVLHAWCRLMTVIEQFLCTLFQFGERSALDEVHHWRCRLGRLAVPTHTDPFPRRRIAGSLQSPGSESIAKIKTSGILSGLNKENTCTSVIFHVVSQQSA